MSKQVLFNMLKQADWYYKFTEDRKVYNREETHWTQIKQYAKANGLESLLVQCIKAHNSGKLWEDIFEQ